MTNHDLTEEWLKRIADSAAKRAERRAREYAKLIADPCGGTPIEKALLVALDACSTDNAGAEFVTIWPARGGDLFNCFAVVEAAACAPLPVLMHVFREVTIDAFRVDFLCVAVNSGGKGNYRLLVVECDGHQYHDRTREQASKDRARDRALAQRSIKVFRFTGQDIWNDPVGCAESVIDEMFQMRWHSQDGMERIPLTATKEAAE